MEKPWILEIPILKTLSLTLLAVHCMGIPLVLGINTYPNFFATTDFLKLIFITTSFGVIFTCGIFAILLLKEVISNSYRAYDVKLYETLLVNILICFCLGDLTLIAHYMSDRIILDIPAYTMFFLSGVFGVVMYDVLKKVGNRRNQPDDDLPPTGE
ncbi:hypothetical protein SAMN05421820_101527 [Pedobacter steynii]|uniref:Uncharacterized protein n=1 Tax=Pedobacter steynii TaxID=430522 RepID=A0A1G9KC31_9SPHI|nr:hypothetical protein [Pedobacter steynii]NQX38503.1 hypothetical protein [Pedobacter steynii]SDL46994.1 hypothetical protein SAMN05421820_101527 [Pedobacter steynii]